MKRKLIQGCFGFAGLMALILDGQTALRGAAAGVGLCLRTVIPSLFPFLFLCALLTDSLWGASLSHFHGIPKKLGIPDGAESLLLAATLGGYPAGAQAIGEAYREGRLEKQDAAHLLTFCSNAGPAFLFGITALQFPRLSDIWALWIIQLLSALVTGWLGKNHCAGQASLKGNSRTVSEILTQTTRTMAILCGWILLFQILLGFLERWFFWYCTETWQVVLTGLLELSSGCCALGRISNENLRFLICSGMLSFGGLCVVMQTAAVIGTLPMKPYLLGKLTQTGISLGLALLYLRFGWVILGIVFLIFLLPRKKKWISPNIRCIIPLSSPGGKIHVVS